MIAFSFLVNQNSASDAIPLVDNSPHLVKSSYALLVSITLWYKCHQTRSAQIPSTHNRISLSISVSNTLAPWCIKHKHTTQLESIKITQTASLQKFGGIRTDIRDKWYCYTATQTDLKILWHFFHGKGLQTSVLPSLTVFIIHRRSHFIYLTTALFHTELPTATIH